LRVALCAASAANFACSFFILSASSSARILYLSFSSSSLYSSASLSFSACLAAALAASAL
jgi:hypothetical protein